MLNKRHWDRHRKGGLNFTEIGFGTAPLGNLYKSISDEDAEATLNLAWDSGLRYFDTAPLYGLGLSETRLNRFLRGKPRDEYVLSTKVGRLMRPCSPQDRTGIGKWFDVPQRQEHYDYSYDGIMRSVDFSFERLGISRIDILYVHDLCIFTHGSKQKSEERISDFFEKKGYHAMLSLRDQNIISAIGGGINEWEVCQQLAERGDFDLFLLAGRYTLLEQEALDSFLPLCEARGIGIITGGPYNSGILATGAVPGAFYNYDPAPEEIMKKVNQIEEICRRYNVPLKAAALQFPLLHPAHFSVIPGGQSTDEMSSNLESINFEIPGELWLSLKKANLMHPNAPTG
jgi:D-threo-aldose 1-dehydrogenase